MDGILKYEANPEEDFYAILGCAESSSTEQINAEFKVRALKLHPDKNLDDPQIAKEFSKLQRAREVLSDEKQRADYENWRRSGLAISFDFWRSKRDSMHTSLHWAMKVKQEPAIAGVSDANMSTTPVISQKNTSYGDDWRPSGWERNSQSALINKFRNYQI